MNNNQCPSHSGIDGDVILCKPLQQLKDEHIALNKLKLEMFELSEDIYDIKEDYEISIFLKKLRDKTLHFHNELEPHSEREEGILFPMLARYIGRETGPIAMMEFEHDMAKGHLSAFLIGTEKIHDDITMDDALVLINHVTQAYQILTQHFRKEEFVLFPLAENTLTDKDKEELEGKIK